MFSNLQISRTLAKNTARMQSSNKTISQEAMQAEWLEVQAAQQNPAYFRPLYDRYFNQIFRFIFKRTGDENIANDICSQVFLKAIQKIGTYEYKGVPFSAWLYRVASNEVAQYFRNTQKNRVVTVEEHTFSDLIDEVSEEGDFEKIRQSMLGALQQLKESDMVMIEMRFFEERPFKEIAQILSITESNAKVKTYRILEKMKKIMKKNS
ncbi:MAG: sigma-70 family RNA polymerase sigma factor [Saprospiraceae bacterium]|jgi:RNA polymerase sigma-70 factor (ECF subfamily)|nr:sigma-70 family RNA polymerase sigma factor [Saprospiraceae bacterium]MDG2417349.1 sigma-70 family RNA polymerase sigma factor [Saprospiraceae bacterium]